MQRSLNHIQTPDCILYERGTSNLLDGTIQPVEISQLQWQYKRCIIEEASRATWNLRMAHQHGSNSAKLLLLTSSYHYCQSARSRGHGGATNKTPFFRRAASPLVACCFYRAPSTRERAEIHLIRIDTRWLFLYSGHQPQALSESSQSI